MLNPADKHNGDFNALLGGPTLRPEHRALVDKIWSEYIASPPADWPHGPGIRLSHGRRRTLDALEDMPAGIVTVGLPDGRYVLTLLGVFLTSDGVRHVHLLRKFLSHLQSLPRDGTSRRRVGAMSLRGDLALSHEDSRLLGRLVSLARLYGDDFRHGDEWECGLPSNLDEVVEIDNPDSYLAGLAKADAERAISWSRGPQVDSARAPESLWFVSDEALRTQLVLDYEELRQVHAIGALKSTVILAGGILEGILLDALGRNLDTANEAYQQIKVGSVPKLDRWTLNDLVEVAGLLALLPRGQFQLSHGLREFRDLVHPGRQLREKIVLSLDEAEVAFRVVKICLKSLSQFAEAGGQNDVAAP